LLKFDTLIIGSGLAGLTLALKLAGHQKVGIITKKSLLDGASSWAQGGIAAVLSEEDSIAAHIQDTVIAGAGLCDEAATRYIIEHGKTAIAWLIEQGVPFTKDASTHSGYHLTREGGHSERRIIHAADRTGQAVQETLARRVLQHANITVLEKYISVDLITGKKLGLDDNRCHGVYALNSLSDEVITISAQNTVLATGGTGKVYMYTTNPDTATGDGIAMAWRAGCRVANMEFIQFHPTCLYHPHAKSFLISEAVRGEGGILKLPDGTRFMPWHDKRAELAPRDVVARAIDFEMKKRGLDCVYLDISHQSVEFLQEHFPTIYARCLSLGINISKEAIPVVPAAHYTCGGIMSDLHARTDIGNLYAVGETAYTGLHGANRLASNSLLECLVFADAAAQHILGQPAQAACALPAWDESRVTDADEQIVIAHNWAELRHFMWDYVGIVRTNKRLERAQHRIQLLQDEIQEYYANFHISSDLLELRNLVTNADLIVRSALSRQESRGLHYSKDYPETLPHSFPTVLTPKPHI
jgi:L-aspartate oxidase